MDVKKCIVCKIKKDKDSYKKDRNICKNCYNMNRKRYKVLNTILKSVDSIVIIGSTSTSVTLSITGVGLILVPITAGIACGVSLCNKLL